mgnify:CR=1 FL=1|jgi:hypothetical protein
MKIIQIVPWDSGRLYGAIVKKEAAIRKANKGTFFRVSRTANSTKWQHKNYKGSVKLQKALSGIITAEVTSRLHDQESRLMEAFLGWVGRHFGDQIATINIHYRD